MQYLQAGTGRYRSTNTKTLRDNRLWKYERKKICKENCGVGKGFIKLRIGRAESKLMHTLGHKTHEI